MNKKKILLGFLIAFFSLCIFAGGKKDVEENFTVKVVTPAGGPSIALSKIIFEKTQFLNSVTDYEVVVGPDMLQAKILSGDADIAIVGTNLAAILNSKTDNFVFLGPVVWGNMYCISAEDIENIDGLRGKTIFTFGRGTSPDLTVREVFKANGIDPDKEVKFEYLSAASDIPPAFLSGKASVAVIPEPLLSVVLAKKNGTKVVVDVQKEWKTKIGNSSYPQAGLIVKKDFLQKHPKYVKEFLKAAEKSIDWVNANSAEAAEYSSKIMKMPPAKIVAKAIPKLNLKFVYASDAKKAIIQYFEILAKTDKKHIGGKLPKDDFYYKSK